LRGSAPTPSLIDRAPEAVFDSVIRVLGLSRTVIWTNQIRGLTRAIAALVNSLDGGDDRGVCVSCGKPITRQDPFLRYGGRYYHGGSCIESDPPALRARAQPGPNLTARNENVVVELRLARGQEAVWVWLTGPLDLASVRDLGAGVRELAAVGIGHVIIDLRGLTFMDSSGVDLLAALATQAKRDGWQLSLIQGAPAIRRVFALTGALSQLPFTSPATILQP
jgi:anti-sigma B factor antagonist